MTHRRAPERILVMAHAHPDFSLGGGEIAAYNLFQAYRRNEHVEQAWFLGRADRGRGASGHIGLRRPGEYLWEQGVSDWHLMKAAHQASLTTWFADLVRALEEQKTTLERARAEAESAAVAKGLFLATMSHEIRTPMNGILGMIELAQGTELDDERHEYLATACSSAHALLQLLGDVLGFGRPIGTAGTRREV